MKTPRFNHVALSMPPSALDDRGRADLIAFYEEALGWEEMPTMTKPGERLVLQAYSYDQFVFIVADEHPMTCPSGDHFGMEVGSREELEIFHGRAQQCAARDDRVELTPIEMEDYGYLKLHNFYVRFLLPMRIEVQHWEWTTSSSG